MRKFIIIYLFVFAALLLLTQCKRDVMQATQVKYASSNFSVISTLNIFDANGINDDHPNFDLKNNYDVPLNPIFFTASFNEEVSWKIVIAGKASGAVKEITGIGKTIDKTNAIWQGDATSIRFFLDNNKDTCIASLYVAGKSDPLANKQVVINKLKSFQNLRVDGVRSMVVEDFDMGNLMGGLPEALNSFSIDNIMEGTGKYKIDSTNNAVQGTKYLHMEGKDLNNNGWILGVNHASLIEMINTGNTQLNLSTTNSSSFFVNAYIRGNGKPNTSIEFKMYELDFAKSPQHLIDTISLNAYVYNLESQKKCDGYIYTIVVDWEGWKKVSIPYSAFHAANDLTAGGNGNRIKEPWKISGMAVSLLSYPQYGQEVSADIDYIVVTEGGPFSPKY